MNSIFFSLFIRNFLKGKLLNILNVCSLAIGIVAALLIILYTDHEYSYDNFHQSANQIYRLEAKTNSDEWFANLGMEHARELQSGVYPEVGMMVQINTSSRTFIKNGGNKFVEEGIYFTTVDSKFFELFDFDILEGNKQTMLSEPYSTVLTSSIAKKYFGEQSPIGRTLSYDSISLSITGVVQDLPTNSHFDFDMLITNPSTYQRDHYHTRTYIQLQGGDPAGLASKVKEMDVAYDQYHKLADVRLMPITDIHLSSDVSFGANGKGDRMQLAVFMLMAGMILFMTTLNYVNLSLTVFLNKGREIGIRKTLGETHVHVIKSFLTDSFLMTSFSVPLIIGGLLVGLQIMSDFLEVDLVKFIQTSPVYVVYILIFLLSISVISALIPILMLKGANVNDMIKTKVLMNNGSSIRFRNGLLFLQLIFLFSLGISAWFMNRQITYLDNKDLGFDVKGVIKIENAWDIGDFENYKILKNNLLGYAHITGVTFGPMIGDGMSPLTYRPEGHTDTYENLLSYGVDIDYFDVMGMEILRGDFKTVLQSSEDGQVTSLVNESFIKRYGWGNDPIGKKIVLRPDTENELNRKVSAVFGDFHFFSFQEKIAPQIISLRPDPQFVNTNILVKTTSKNLPEVISQIEEQWYQLKPDIPFEFRMMDDAVKSMYLQERKAGQLSLTFSMIAIAMSALGIVSFMIYLIGSKAKEIAVRRVLGASLLQIIGLMNKQLFYTVLIAAIIGSLSSYWLVQRWLADYAYGIGIDIWTFPAAAGLVYLAIFLITTFQSIKGTQFNPGLALKEE